MPVIDATDRLQRLYRLRDRINAEIREAEAAARRAAANATARRRMMADPTLVRAWAAQHHIPIAARGRIPGALIDQYLDTTTR